MKNNNKKKEPGRAGLFVHNDQRMKWMLTSYFFRKAKPTHTEYY